MRLFDPFGQPLDSSTLAIGTDVSDDQVDAQANSGWYGAVLKVTETAGSTAVIEMGARLYVPALGSFLQVDPIEGGGDNDYVWPPDPVGKSDLSGKLSADAAEIWIARGNVVNGAGIGTGLVVPSVFAPVGSIPHQYDGSRPSTPKAVRRTAPQPLVRIGPNSKPLKILTGGASGCYFACLSGGVSIDGHPYIGVDVGVSLKGGFNTESATGLMAGGECTANLGPFGGYVESGWTANGDHSYSGAGAAFGVRLGCSASVGWTF